MEMVDEDVKVTNVTEMEPPKHSSGNDVYYEIGKTGDGVYGPSDGNIKGERFSI